MRFRIVVAVGVVCFAPSVWTQSAATVPQLEWFLGLKNLHVQADSEIAIRLSGVQLVERLSKSELNRILSSDELGPQSTQALLALAAESQLREAPRSAWMRLPAPDSQKQRQWIEAMRTYARETVRHLPDFVATRVSRTFENVPIASGQMNKKPIVRLHFMREARRHVTYRGGYEIIENATGGAARSSNATADSFENWGEFGPILRMLMNDSVDGSLRWGHWEESEGGQRLAVFQYRVPEAASHYSINFCCYQENPESPWRALHAKPGYHGEIFFDPAARTITAISLVADFPPGSELTESGLAVQYENVQIGGRNYMCPVRSVAISVNRDFRLKAIDHIGLDRHINAENFTDYHKFGSNARILPPNQ